MAHITSHIMRVEKDDEPLLRRIGYAVIVQWHDLPIDVQDVLLEQADYLSEPHQEVTLLREGLEALIRRHNASRKPAVGE